MTELTSEHVMDVYARRAVEFASGRGCTLVDDEGDEYLDLIAGLAVASTGHAHPEVVRAIAEQAAKLIHVSNLYETRPQKDLAARLHDLTGMLSFFCNSGAEAIECSLKLVRRYAGRFRAVGPARVVACNGGFHGRTFGALAATGQPPKQEPFAPMLPGFTHVPYGDLDAMTAAMSPEVAAVMLEPIQGEAGVIVPPAGYLAGVRALCDEWGALLIVDEVQTGIGRTGGWFAFESAGIAPDILCLAKGLASGLPIGVCLATPKVASVLQRGDHGSTFGGGPVPAAAALATLDVIEKESLLERALVAGQRLIAGLERSLHQDASMRGAGLLLAVDLGAPIAARVTDLAFERRVLVNDVTASAIRLAPPLVIEDEEIDRAVTVIGEVVHEIGAD